MQTKTALSIQTATAMHNLQQPKGVNMDKLATAFATMETSNCSKGSGVSRNNCFGIMEWPNGKRQLKRYRTTQDSFVDFKRIWTTKYSGGFPSLYEVKRWTASERPEEYLAGLRTVYYK